MIEPLNQRISSNEFIYELSDKDTDKAFFTTKNYLSNKLKVQIEIKMGGVMDEFYSSFFWNSIKFKLEYCNWTGTEIKVSKFISQSEKNQVDKLVLELIQELKKEIS